MNSIGSNIDISPTILPFIGYTEEVGLGRNLLKYIKSDKLIKNYKEYREKQRRLNREIKYTEMMKFEAISTFTSNEIHQLLKIK